MLLPAAQLKAHLEGPLAPLYLLHGDEPLLVIGYKVTCADGTKGDHAALSLKDGNVVSWGSVVKREAPVEEAWGLQWEV